MLKHCIIIIFNRTSITFSKNSFSGNIPTCIFELPIIEDIDLSYNMFSGELPQHPCLNNNLVELNLDNNLLNGEIPGIIYIF